MKLFFEESVGRRVPSALQHVGAPCDEIAYPTRSGAFRLGMSDLEWMELAGRSGHLTITHDLHILDVPEERAALANWHLGTVFLDAGQATRWRVLRTLVNRWEWLEQIDTATARRFAFHLSRKCRVQAVPL